jgi:hypothetical protein
MKRDVDIVSTEARLLTRHPKFPLLKHVSESSGKSQKSLDRQAPHVRRNLTTNYTPALPEIQSDLLRLALSFPNIVTITRFFRKDKYNNGK